MSRSTLAKDVLFPMSRFLAGSLYKASEKDADGKPRLVKSGPNQGQPTQQYWFAFGIPKTPGVVHWGNEPWGAPIWALGNAAFPKIAESATFAWKIADGDSVVPNTKGVKPCERPGYPGHWVVSCSSTHAPKIVNNDGSTYLKEEGYVMPGDYIEVHATVDSNGSSQRPGVYINHNVVSFQGYSAEGRIVTGVDPTAVGFGKNVKPAALTAIPPSGGGAAQPTPAPGPAPALPSAGAPAPSVPAPMPVQPAPGFMQPGAMPAMPSAAPKRVMLGAMAGFTYEQAIAQNWTDSALIAAGYMAAA